MNQTARKIKHTPNLEQGIDAAKDYLLGLQDKKQGYWWAELEANASITARHVMLLKLLKKLTPVKAKKMQQYLLDTQREDGTWPIFYGGEGNLGATIECYFALKLLGQSSRSKVMLKARQFILENGGLEQAPVFIKIHLAMFNAFDWDLVPAMPVWLSLIPSFVPFNIYDMSSWSRSCVVPLLIIQSIKPVMHIHKRFWVDELFVHGRENLNDLGIEPARLDTTKRIFVQLDTALRWLESMKLSPGRETALDAAEQWILDHQEPEGDWGGIYPAMAYSLLALHFRGYDSHHPVMQKGLAALERFAIDDGHSYRMQSCVSPIWDTGHSCNALLDAGLAPDHPALQKAADWLLKKEVHRRGDWSIKSKGRPGGWSFEFFNTLYPDVDDTAVVAMVLNRIKTAQDPHKKQAIQRGLKWVMSMECSGSGWAAFDKDNDRYLFNQIPFADHGALLDPPSEDLTGRVLEFLGCMGYNLKHPAAQRAIHFIEARQDADGPWYSRWAVNYINGTWSVLSGLNRIGYDMKSLTVRRAVEWLKQCQNDDGGWGETCDSYINPELKGQGSSTASQTAWAIMALLEAGEVNSTAVQHGVDYLLTTQDSAGTWDEPYFTGTGFPGQFYINYHLYRHYFPLMALGRYREQGSP